MSLSALSTLGPMALLGLAACGGASPPPEPPSAPIPVFPGEPTPVARAPAEHHGAPSAGASTVGQRPAELTFKGYALPGAAAPAPLDYIAYESGRGRVWVPVGNTGSVDVFDIAKNEFTVVGGFKTEERENKGQKRVMGPSSVAIGEGVAYVGNRADGTVCAVDAHTLRLGKCLKMPSSPDGVAYVPFAKEVWVTTPRDKSIVVLDAAKPAALSVKTVIRLEGSPEGYTSDASRGVFVTNLEDQDKTVVIDVATHKAKATLALDCSSAGPRGVATDSATGLLMVACTDGLRVLNRARDGWKASADTGAGVDNIDWLPSKRLVYVAAGKAERLTVVRVDDKGQPTVVAIGTSAPGARNVVVDSNGNAYVADGTAARLLVFPAPVLVP